MHLDCGTLELAVLEAQLVHLEFVDAVLSQVQIGLAQDAMGLVTGHH